MPEKKKFSTEFKEFISRGNVVDMAVGIVVGGAFTSIVTSLVNQIIMPAVGFLFGRINFSDYKIVLAEAVGDTAEVAIQYGSFIQTIINFLLVSLCVFLLIKGINKLRRKQAEAPKEPEKPAEPSEEILLLREIRDNLKK